LHEQETIIVLDFGNGKSHVMARRIRELKVFSVILPYHASPDKITSIDAKGIVFSTGSSSSADLERSSCDPAVYQLGLPILAIEPESDPAGQELLKSFLFEQCGCRGLWNIPSFLQDSIEHIRRQAGEKKVICGLSGGVDSSVAAMLVHRAIGEQLTCVFVDHGLLRKDEGTQVKALFGDKFKINLISVDAKERFMAKLAGVTDPESKRKIIGEEFIRVFEEEADKLGHIDFLVQGTLYPDVVESSTAGTTAIKSHHNVGGLPEDMRLQLIEPLYWLFKDEARLLGAELGLPEEILWRHPFPGPGLGVRIIGAVDTAKVALLQEADAIFIEEIKKAGLYRQIWQAFAALPDMKSVGVTAGKRTFAYTVALRAITSHDAMTADWVRLPYDLLDTVTRRITTEVPYVNRVVYDITAKPPATIEWE
jgi:GMP synthase (glutamine-hydrolysing)